TPGLEPVPSPVPEPLCCEMCVSCLLLFSTCLSCAASILWISVGSTGVVALEGCFPLATTDSRGADSAVVVDEISKVNVNSVIESPKQLSLRQSKTVNSRAFACKTLVDHRGK
nr:hypothetical protein [Tanacetum cinerariifolium]